MKTEIRKLCLISLPFVLAATQLGAQVPANSTPREQVQQLTAQLQNSPTDGALREKIVALALTLNPRPATPEAAIMAEGAAEYAFKNAKVNSDFSDAAKQYEKALLLAPWLAADYFNCGVAHERAGENKEAISSFGFYLLTSPGAEDALAVKKRIGGLQYAAQKTAETAKEQASAADEQAREAARLAAVYQGLDGGVWKLVEIDYTVNNDPPRINRRPANGEGSAHLHIFIEVHGRQIEMYGKDDVNGRESDTWNMPFTSRQFYAAVAQMSSTVTISDDGRSITTDHSGTNPHSDPDHPDASFKLHWLFQRVN
jgi:hypothetical protein